jgi:hypothetical protein
MLDNKRGARAYSHTALDRFEGSLRRGRDLRWGEVFSLLLVVLTGSCLLLFLFFTAHLMLWPMAWGFTTLVFLGLFTFVSRDYVQTVRYVEDLEERLMDMQEAGFEELRRQK